MPEIVVTVKNKMAVGDGSVIVCNNSDYVVRFALDSEWDALALRTMRIVYDSYSHTDIAFSGDTVALPTIIDRTSIGIGLYSGDIHTSTCAMFDCERSVMGKNSNAVAPPSSDVYNEIVKMINDGRLKGDKGADGTNGADGANGADGVTFTPSVDSAGNLSWTNDGGLSNPAPVNIKGATGATGERGEQGIPGERGTQGDKGDKGDKGDPGAPGKDGSDANVTAENIQSALGYTPVTPSDLAAKQDVLTDADKQSITKIGMTTGAAWTAAEQKTARERMGLDKPYELIEEIVINESVTQVVRTNMSLAEMRILVEVPVSDSTGAVGIEVYSKSTLISYSYIGNLINKENIKMAKLSAKRDHGAYVFNTVAINANSAPQKAGVGTLSETASLFPTENAITKISLYSSSNAIPLPIGTKITIEGEPI